MDWTDRHYRFMMRMITKETLLFTEMVVDQTVSRHCLLCLFAIVGN
jgi:tRNA-dihydrouridine synthase A